MRTVYKVLAYLVAIEVVVQAAAMVYAVAGLGIWVDRDGGVLDKAAMESDGALFPEMYGFLVHGMNGMMLIPVIALLLLISSFFAKVPKGIRTAAAVLALVVLQVTLGIYGHQAAVFGLLHGVNALLLFTTALYAARSASRARTVDQIDLSEGAGERRRVRSDAAR